MTNDKGTARWYVYQAIDDFKNAIQFRNLRWLRTGWWNLKLTLPAWRLMRRERT